MRRARIILAATALLALAGVAPAAANAAAAPAWAVTIAGQPTNFAPGTTSEYVLIAANIGAAPTSGTSTFRIALPKAWSIVGYGSEIEGGGFGASLTCTPAAKELACTTEKTIYPGRVVRVAAKIEVPLGEEKALLQGEAFVEGGGAANGAKATAPTPVQKEAVPPGILPGFAAPITGEDGGPVALAGSHPYQQTISFGFPTVNPEDVLTGDGHPRNFSVELPRGLIGSPAASSVLCTEAQLTILGCPDASQVGVVTAFTNLNESGPISLSAPLYNMVAPPGSPAELATDVGGFGVFAHVLANVRSDGDFGIEAKTRDTIAFGLLPIFNVLGQVFGTPSATAHDHVRGDCVFNPGECALDARSEAPFLTLPADCPGAPMPFGFKADTWEEPNPSFPFHEASYESADLAGAPVFVEGCDELEFEPTLGVAPTTLLTDSPTGLHFELEQTQGTPQRVSSPLRDLSLTLPAGLVVNPASASGLQACSEAQIGFEGKEEEGSPRFSKAPQSCPDAAKIGTAEATSPLLVARNEDHEIEKDPETGEPVLKPVKGAMYVATPFKNPFGSLVAAYFVIEDEETGIIAKLAGKGRLNPQNGQISVSFTQSPELPLKKIQVDLLDGARSALTTPPVCGSFESKAQLIPWSAPDEALARGSSFQLSAAPGGGPCPTTEASMPHSPSFAAGMVSPAAGKFSPLVLKVSRVDGSQRWQRLEAKLPSGLSAKLAGVGECPPSGIDRARSRETPEAGALEQQDPSCPASSLIGTAIAAAGSGPNPFHTSGRVYLAGPYKGAPLSAVAIAPAVAGPFDLGTVVVRSALYLDPETAQGRVVSDPFPAILDGVPIDLRKVSIATDRPGFTLNPTSCDEKSFGGGITSTLGQIAPLFARFQVGGCKSLPYKPKLSIRLKGPVNRGGHPALRAVFTAKPGEANTAAISFAFPRSEFIDQAHFRTICTRVQFAANQCPAGAIYGHVTAYTPLLDYPLRGPAYLRSSSHKLPDLVLALRGPAYQPIVLDAVGRVDSVKGRLRVRFETVPDAPLSKVIVTAQGAKKGLFQNSTNICKGTHRATLKLRAQSGKVTESSPKLAVKCNGKGAKKKLHRNQ